MRETVHLLSDTADITGKVTKYFTILEIRTHFPLVLLERHTKSGEVESFELQPRREVESFSPSA